MPYAEDVFGTQLYRRIYQRSSATLRELEDTARRAITDLEIERRDAPNAWIALEDEFEMAALSHVDAETLRQIEEDLSDAALEGESEERKQKYRRRAAWRAEQFVQERQREGKLQCDDCGFDPTQLFDPAIVKPRSMLDVHHKNPLSRGPRYTTSTDFALLCPTCHRAEHRRLDRGLPSKHSDLAASRIPN
jgi:5-methylcytosine-specific restriction protein A